MSSNRLTYGIDKTIVGLEIISVDFKKLEYRRNATIKPNNQDYTGNAYPLENGESFDSITIKDNDKFVAFRAGVHMNIPWASLDLSAAEEGRGNVTPLHICEYNNRLNEAFNHLDEAYGIRCIGKETAKLKKLELNMNIPINHPFNDYVRVLKTFILNAPKRYKTDSQFRKRDIGVKTLSVTNKQQAAVFYDKREHIRNTYGYDIGYELLRIEYKLQTASKIEEVFGTRIISQISNADILNFLKSQFRKDFMNPLHNLRMSNFGKLRRLIINHKKREKYWINRLIFDLLKAAEEHDKPPLLLDVCELWALLKKVTGSNFDRTKKKLESRLPSVYFNQFDKFFEVFEKVSSI